MLHGKFITRLENQETEEGSVKNIQLHKPGEKRATNADNTADPYHEFFHLVFTKSVDIVQEYLHTFFAYKKLVYKKYHPYCSTYLVSLAEWVIAPHLMCYFT